jgi:hypothetical protein
MSSNQTTEINTSIRTIDLRCRIADQYDFLDDVREQIAQSDSSSLAAIYFHKDKLTILADELGIEPAGRRKPALLDAIREAVGCEPRDGRGLDWLELRRVVQELDIDVADDCYYDVATGEDFEPATDDDSGVDARDTGPWADWQEGEI